MQLKYKINLKIFEKILLLAISCGFDDKTSTIKGSTRATLCYGPRQTGSLVVYIKLRNSTLFVERHVYVTPHANTDPNPPEYSVKLSDPGCFNKIEEMLKAYIAKS